MVTLTHEFYLSPTITSIRNCGTNRAGFALAREAIFIRLLAYSSSGIYFESVEHFCSLVSSNEQAKLVWDYCLSAGILQKTESGYSASRWISSNGKVKKTSTETLQNLPPSTSKRGRLPKHTSESNTPPKVGQISQGNGIDETDGKVDETDCRKTVESPKDNPLSSTNDHDEHPQTDNREDVKVESITDAVTPAAPIQQAAPIPPAAQEAAQIPTQNDHPGSEVKERVRPNVFLTRSEINDLKSRFTDSQITLMLDKLSEYKSESKRYYASDFDAIERWVIKWLDGMTNNQSQKKASVYDEPFEVPSWLTGR